MADWIDQNQSLVAGIISLGFAIGTTLMMIGQITLGFISISMWTSGWGAGAGKGVTGALGAFSTNAVASAKGAVSLTSSLGKLFGWIFAVWIIYTAISGVIELVTNLYKDQTRSLTELNKAYRDFSGLSDDAANAMFLATHGQESFGQATIGTRRNLQNFEFAIQREADALRDLNKVMSETVAGEIIPGFLGQGGMSREQLLREGFGGAPAIAGVTDIAKAGNVELNMSMGDFAVNINTPAVNTELDFERITSEVIRQLPQEVFQYANVQIAGRT